MNRCFRCRHEGVEVVHFFNGDMSLACQFHADEHLGKALCNRAIKEAETEFFLALEESEIARNRENQAVEALLRAKASLVNTIQKRKYK